MSMHASTCGIVLYVDSQNDTLMFIWSSYSHISAVSYLNTSAASVCTFLNCFMQLTGHCFRSLIVWYEFRLDFTSHKVSKSVHCTVLYGYCSTVWVY